MSENTPMMKQYLSIKEKNRDSVLFFRMGDFYEMFKGDAVEVSRLLNLTLTKRHGIPMCGIPYHASQNYIGRLLKAGKKIAICEQISLAKGGKGIAERDVVQIITPGTVIDEDFLDKGSNNYLAAIGRHGKDLSVAYIDLSTGEFLTTTIGWTEKNEKLRKELMRISPREIIVQESMLNDQIDRILEQTQAVINRYPDWNYDIDTSRIRLERHFKVASMKGFGFADNDTGLLSAGVIIEYVEETSKSLLSHIRHLASYKEQDFVSLDEATQKNLELIRNMQDNSSSFTLVDVLDYTRTAMGARKLKHWLLKPLNSKNEINSRLDKVSLLYREQAFLSDLRNLLGGILDLERLSARIAMEKAHAKDLIAVKQSLLNMMEIEALLRRIPDRDISILDSSDLDEISSIYELLDVSIMENPSILFTEGRLIREGYDEQVDNLRNLKKNSRSILDEYLRKEKEDTGIGNLKIKYNKIIGYFFEISKGQLSQVPEHYIRRQSLVNAERFTTDNLISLETEINNSTEKIIEIERDIFFGIRKQVARKIDVLLDVCSKIARLDCLQSYAYCATIRGYTRPMISESGRIRIIEGRHPVVEAHLPAGEFVANGIDFDKNDRSFALITGPNMAGKSTYLRQIALIVLMAQAGSFVPAGPDSEIGIVDKIFCRVGASDNLARGESTFLVEMNETANILRTATEDSLIIMDEVGRGTSTNDGLSIAWGVSEYLMEDIGAKTLFATHYHELTHMDHKKMYNLSMDVRENKGEILFMKKVKEGPSNNSYGIHVAGLAGLPQSIISRSRSILSYLESRLNTGEEIQVPEKSREQESFLFDDSEVIVDEIKGLDIDHMTPLEALNKLDSWKKILGS
ncbi:MAG: DNA mismatch repair protein MutS [Spirochaetales bacterium]|nr:DNA mismatch repair protein MutS [Spirochaetales bacterium]